MSNESSNLTIEMSEQSQHQQESLIQLTRCFLLIRSLSQGAMNCSNDALGAEGRIKLINDLADAAHNLPTVILSSMINSINLEKDQLTKEQIDNFNRSFEHEISMLKQKLL